MLMRSLLTGAALLSLVAMPAFAAGQVSSAPSANATKSAAMTATAVKPADTSGTVKAATPAGKTASKKAALKHSVAAHKMHRMHRTAKQSVKSGTQAAKTESVAPKVAGASVKAGK